MYLYLIKIFDYLDGPKQKDINNLLECVIG